MMRRFVIGLVAAAGLLGAASKAEAQEIQLTGPLKGAPAVKDMRLYRKNRFEIAPAVSFTLLDEYRRTIVAGGRINYNFTDWFAFGAWGGFGAASITTDLTDRIDQNVQRGAPQLKTNVSPNKGGFAEQTAKIQWVLVPQFTFIPFRGKLAIFQKLFVDTDFYVSGGLAIVGLQERGECGGNNQKGCTDPGSFALQSRTAFAPSGALGLNFYPSNFISFGVEYRALPFSWNRAGFDQRGAGTDQKAPDGKVNDEDQTFKWNQMITIAIGFSFPTTPKLSE